MMGLRLYAVFSVLILPVLHLWLWWRTKKGKEDSMRISERFGRASVTRPQGTLIWIHAASVGELNAALPVATELLARHLDLHLLLTTGTVTSARQAEKYQIERMIHQFIPVDSLFAVKRFLAHWHPQMALWLESELWPNLVRETHARAIPMVLVNARMSEKSAMRWQRHLPMFKAMIGCFDAVIAASKSDADRYLNLGAQSVVLQQNIKYDALPLSANETILSSLKQAIKNRPCWLAASTHSGEEVQILDAHIRLQAQFPNILTIIVPRHPARAQEVGMLCAERALEATYFSRTTNVGDAAIYIADIMGEMGTLLRVAPIVLVGGSLIAHGGHNPIEPAQLGCAIMCGPYMFHFADMAEQWLQEGAMKQVQNVETLAAQITLWLTDESTRKHDAELAAKAVYTRKGGLEDLLHRIELQIRKTKQKIAG